MKALTTAACLAALLAGCSGGGSDPTGPDTAPPSDTAGDTAGGDTGNATDGGATDGGTTGGGAVVDAGNEPDHDLSVPADARLHGQLTIREFIDENDRVASLAAARFVVLDPDSERYEDALFRAIDTCIAVPQPSEGLLRVPAEAIRSSVSVGENIVLTSPEGTWATLQMSDSIYLDATADGRIDGRVPSGLTVDVPADGSFPAFAAVALPDPQPTGNAFVPAIGSRVDGTTEYRWAANDAIGSRVHLTIDARELRIDCFADDDGLFTLPADTAASLTAGGTLISAARESTRVEKRAGATLVLTVSTGAP